MNIYTLAIFLYSIQNAVADPVLEIRTGNLTPHLYRGQMDCRAPDFGKVIATLTRYTTSRKLWQDESADATGVAAHYVMRDGQSCLRQGKVTKNGGGLQFDNTSIATGQCVTVLFH